MAVSREAAIWAYRLILGRDPESEAVIAGAMEAVNEAQLRAAFLASAEFAAGLARVMPILPIGRHEQATDVLVQIACSEDEMRRMLANIAREWRKFGETDPHWSVVTNEVFRADNIAASLDAFYAIGEAHLTTMLNPLRRSGVGKERYGRAMDFGCGVGRLSLPLAGVVDHVTGVDISPAHLALARERAEQVGIANVDFVAMDAIEDLDRFAGFDLIVSFIVLQHNPPPVMARLFRKLLDALAHRGCAIIQVPTYITGARFDVAEYLAATQPAMEMNALPQHVVFDIVDAAGCRMLEVREDNMMGADIGLSHTFAIQKR